MSLVSGRWLWILPPPLFCVVLGLVEHQWLGGALIGVVYGGGSVIGVEYLRSTNRDFDGGLGGSVSARHPLVCLAAIAGVGVLAMLFWILRLRSA